MKISNKIIGLLLLVAPSFGFAQFGVNFHQSNLPFVGVNYEIRNKLRPEIRLGTDNFFEQTTLEAIVTYDFVEREDYEFYAGIGVRVNMFEGVVVPVGLNVFPLSTKQFGFHIELAPIVGEDAILRGSWGIRYQFKRGNKN